MAKRLTKSVVDALEPRLAEYHQWCGALPGFGIRVRPSGAKTFVVVYRTAGMGRGAPKRRVTIGAYGIFTVEKARAAAEDILAKARLGVDTAKEKAAVRDEMNVGQLLDLYLEEPPTTKKASTLKTDRSRISAHIRPLLGGVKLSQLDRAAIEKFVRDVTAGKTARNVKTGKKGRSIVRGGRGAATRTARLLGGVLSYAVARGLLPNSPAAGVRLPKDNKNERFLSVAEIGCLGETLRIAEVQGLPWKQRSDVAVKHQAKPENAREIVSPHVIAAIRLMILSGARLREILHLKWVDVDLQRGILNLADSKTGSKKILLAAPAVALLSALPRAGKFVIAGATPDKPRSDIARPWARIIEHAGLPGLRIHDLRHTAASVAAAAGLGLPIIGKLLGHSSAATTMRYAHLGDDPLRRAAERMAEDVTAALGDALTLPQADILPRRRS